MENVKFLRFSLLEGLGRGTGEVLGAVLGAGEAANLAFPLLLMVGASFSMSASVRSRWLVSLSVT
ncbi:MAG: hypothetical protein R2822_08805 [Spirosomataceae bacterium]